MNYSVTGAKIEVYENNYGMEMEDYKVIHEADCYTAQEAKKKAKEFYEKGAEYIEIVHLATDDHAVRYYNPRVGISATGANWAEEFSAQQEI